VRDGVGHGTVLRPGGHDEQVAGGERHGFLALQLDPKRAVPAQEQLVLVVMVPGELAVEACDTDDRVVRAREILGLPGTGRARTAS
jgi:hypothetical protein